MIGYDRYLAILAESDTDIRLAAERTFANLLAKIRAGDSPQAALNAVLKEFNADAVEGFREALNAILQSSLGTTEVKAYKVGRVKLSDALYANAQAVAGVSQQIIEKHMASVAESLELRKTLRALKSARADLLSTLNLPALDVKRQDRRVAALHAKANQCGMIVYAERFRQLLGEKEAVAFKKWLARARALQRLAQVEWPATLVAEKDIAEAQKEWVAWLSDAAGG